LLTEVVPAVTILAVPSPSMLTVQLLVPLFDVAVVRL
jgi:hypothetical protein